MQCFNFRVFFSVDVMIIHYLEHTRHQEKLLQLTIEYFDVDMHKDTVVKFCL